MAAGDGHVVNNWKQQLLLKTVDCNSDTFKIALYNKAYAAAQCTGTPTYNVAPWNADEIAVANYSAGGESIGTPVVAQDDANNRASWDDDGTDVAWTSLGAATIQTAVLYDDTTATKWIAIIWEITTNSNGGNYTLQFASTGMMLLT